MAYFALERVGNRWDKEGAGASDDLLWMMGALQRGSILLVASWRCSFKIYNQADKTVNPVRY
ncbi:hypothetical protein thsrh120_50530 [Rhizobium sp. No.120]